MPSTGAAGSRTASLSEDLGVRSVTGAGTGSALGSGGRAKSSDRAGSSILTELDRCRIERAVLSGACNAISDKPSTAQASRMLASVFRLPWVRTSWTVKDNGQNSCGEKARNAELRPNFLPHFDRDRHWTGPLVPAALASHLFLSATFKPKAHKDRVKNR